MENYKPLLPPEAIVYGLLYETNEGPRALEGIVLHKGLLHVTNESGNYLADAPPFIVTDVESANRDKSVFCDRYKPRGLHFPPRLDTRKEISMASIPLNFVNHYPTCHIELATRYWTEKSPDGTVKSSHFWGWSINLLDAHHQFVQTVFNFPAKTILKQKNTFRFAVATFAMLRNMKTSDEVLAALKIVPQAIEYYRVLKLPK